MNKLLSLVLLSVCLCGCKTTLQSGGAYATTGTNSVVQTVSVVFYNTDLAYKTSYMLVDAVFQFERDNRAFLWSVDPKIKHTLDTIRPQAVAADKQYVAARAAYLSAPTQVGLDNLSGLLINMQRIQGAVYAVKMPGR
jgi:hypothetical protein